MLHRMVHEFFLRSHARIEISIGPIREISVCSISPIYGRHYPLPNFVLNFALYCICRPIIPNVAQREIRFPLNFSCRLVFLNRLTWFITSLCIRISVKLIYVTYFYNRAQKEYYQDLKQVQNCETMKNI